ncbi:hypothetical protein FOC1_g10000519 [Fusarium oxysporum f. sp. cubense race 1]|uniref:Nephrocystin 3-like N-terminal domain-containing protein n=1 Tax=Fusarium oxysporum f. sp. cubense (strain race 1) TaxID=1229664 RepID=N4TN31_FUSC1|nr:hypothetical protein FOC1_g10000519 [Fusarium oxysporum f. sp. cubense race 1]
MRHIAYNWLALSVRCLWVHGIPGSGKTILTSWLIETVKDQCKKVSTVNAPCTSAYYYCYFSHHQDEAAPFLITWPNDLLLDVEDAVSIGFGGPIVNYMNCSA